MLTIPVAVEHVIKEETVFGECSYRGYCESFGAFMKNKRAKWRLFGQGGQRRCHNNGP